LICGAWALNEALTFQRVNTPLAPTSKHASLTSRAHAVPQLVYRHHDGTFGENTNEGDRVQNEKTIEQDVSNETIGSKYPSADTRPSEGFVLEIDGQFESEYGSLMGALKAGFELRRRFPHSQVKLHEAIERTPVAT
jgi:hypothetical protein